MRRTSSLALACLVLCIASLPAAAHAATRPKAPAIAGPTVTGGKATLASFRGKPVFINVWSSW